MTEPLPAKRGRAGYGRLLFACAHFAPFPLLWGYFTYFFKGVSSIYGRKIDFQYELSHRFGWGGITLQFAVESGKIKDAIAWSDALNPDFIHTLPKYLKGLKYRKESICTELGLFWSDDPQEEEMMKDIIEWIQGEEL